MDVLKESLESVENLEVPITTFEEKLQVSLKNIIV